MNTRRFQIVNPHSGRIVLDHIRSESEAIHIAKNLPRNIVYDVYHVLSNVPYLQCAVMPTGRVRHV